MDIVAKFGGSSLANSGQFKKVKSIVEENPDRKYIVPSAPGRMNQEDQKVTDLLYLLYNMADHKLNYKEVLSIITERYNEIIETLEIDIDLTDDINEIARRLEEGTTKNYIASRGEYLNGKILAKYLGYDFVDACEVIHFTDEGHFDEKTSYTSLKKMKEDHQTAVIPGFYGSSQKGEIMTFSRGGSDLTGSIVARGVGAELYENWTDVSGFLSADPHIVDNPVRIQYINYQELRELSYSGARILHEEAIFPVIGAGIPIEIRNTNEPGDEGTYIVEKAPENGVKHTITGISGRKNFSVINIEKVRMNNDLSFYRRVLSVLEANDIYLEHMPSSIDSLSLIISDKYLENKRENVIDELKTFCRPDSIDVHNDISLVTIVGRNMRHNIGVASRVFTALAQNNINIPLIIQGASELNIIVGVDTKDYEKAINTIYRAFFD